MQVNNGDLHWMRQRYYTPDQRLSVAESKTWWNYFFILLRVWAFSVLLVQDLEYTIPLMWNLKFDDGRHLFFFRVKGRIGSPCRLSYLRTIVSYRYWGAVKDEGVWRITFGFFLLRKLCSTGEGSDANGFIELIKSFLKLPSCCWEKFPDLNSPWGNVSKSSSLDLWWLGDV